MSGGVIRSAAKAAARGGYRSTPLADQLAAAASRTTPRLAPATVSATQVPAGASVASVPVMSSSQNAQVGVAVGQKQSVWEEVDGWEVVRGKEEDLFDALHPAPRLVFGPVPTIEEAKEATSDLKDAIEKIYFSSPTTICEGGLQKDALYVPECLEKLDSKVRATTECLAILPSAPRHVIQAFSLLQESPEAQTVVASLASDKNVWDAVMKNEKVMEFYKSHQINAVPEATSEYTNEYDGDKNGDHLSEKPLEKTENVFVGLMNTIKSVVSEMVSNISVIIQDLLGSSAGPASATATETAPKYSYTDMGIGGSFIALAVAVILLILVKRG